MVETSIMENFSLGLNVYGSHLYVSKYFICWSSVCPWALGKGKGMPIAQYLLPENSNIFSDQIHFCNKCAIDPSESILLHYCSWLQLMTYFFSSTEARKIFSSCRIISGGFIGCLFHPPLHFVAKSPKKISSLFSIFVRLHKFEYMLEKVWIFLIK